ncbi:hypothetical protein [Halocalculus aciditolerans]|uniref:Uncharacterized protein n=1 Tax=Halocalculus aciditolerans TaxID=1383812 RepID=A0A830FFQ1_9EURY|nr:hypothetical protein [Halocalculus aciditolerans]GGL48648.1 hypothetical protein GCM10009039_03560 [Halocalculus aciditolerans]
MDRISQNRRFVLTGACAAIVSVAGCSGTESNTEYPTATAEPDTVEDGDAEMTADIVDGFSDGSPARLEIAYTNTADEERSVSFGPTPPFSEYWSADSDLVIIPDDQSAISAVNATGETGEQPSNTPEETIVPSEAQDGCWKARSQFASWERQRTVTLPSGDTVKETYSVLSQTESRGCLAEGTYRFSQQSYFEDGSSWGFSIRLGQP